MAGEMAWNDLKALEALLTPAGASEEDRDFTQCSFVATPASIGTKPVKNHQEGKKEEVDPDFEIGDRYGRIQPEYEILYKQEVGANDVYFQMSGKNASSLCCDTLVLRVKLPRTESINDINLVVKPTYTKLSSPIYFLALYLPYSIKSEESCARWEVDTETLNITMPIERDPII